jgi:DUF4097 and DUF4098 domain-containing protein YvlB
MRLAPFALLLTTGCVLPTYKASRVIELTIPAAALDCIDCESHNGDITVTGDAAATDVTVRAELSVRGFSQEEADANLHLLEVARDEVGGTLRLRGRFPAAELANRGPTFTFALRVPPRLRLELATHNGDLTANDMAASAKLTTHNGDIGAVLTTNHVFASTHNGDVRLRLHGDGALDGEVRSHNGDLELTLADGLGARVEASTHNGRVRAPRARDASSGKRWLRGKLGNGAGELRVQSHNGDVTFH